MNKKLLISLSSVIFLFIIGCEKEKTPEKKGVFVSTSAITDIALEPSSNTVSAKAVGDADFVNESITERGFCWATTAKPTIADSKATSGNGAGNFSADLTALTFGTVYYVRAYAIDNSGKAYYGNEVKFTASVPIELIKNGGFETEDLNVPLINAAFWNTDETNAGIIGRATNSWTNSPDIWANDNAKGFYQVVGTVPSGAADFVAKLDVNCSYRDWDPAAILSVTFSAYSGNDPSTRIVIGTAEFGGSILYNGWDQNNFQTKTATFSLAAGSAHAGENLVIEFDISSYIPAPGDTYYDPNAWYDFDNASVMETLK